MNKFRVAGLCLTMVYACMAASAEAQTTGAVKTQVAEIKTLDEARAHVAWKRDLSERLLPSSTTAAAARDYVQRTRGVGASDYRVTSEQVMDNSHVYRVTLTSVVKGISPDELVFDVIVDALTGTVLGENGVSP